MKRTPGQLIRLVRPAEVQHAPEPEPQPTDADAPPEWEEAWAEKWAELVNELRAAGKLTVRSLDLVRLYVISWFEADSARQQVAQDGAVLVGPKGGLFRSPYLQIARNAETTCVKLARELGLTRGR